jgi:CRISPR/Cas system endoribonuclease Cas6 (RAMP superfamily)
VRRVLEEVLPQRRETWAERLLLALWLQAGGGEVMPAGRSQDCVVPAHELLRRQFLADSPAMPAIAGRRIFAARARTW